MHLLKNRISPFLEHHNLLIDEQNGFRPNRCCQNHIALLQEIIHQRKRNKQNTFITFLDLTKAYDSVWQDGLWKKAIKLGIKGKTLRLLIHAYSKATSNIKTPSIVA